MTSYCGILIYSGHYLPPGHAVFYTVTLAQKCRCAMEDGCVLHQRQPLECRQWVREQAVGECSCRCVGG